MAKAIVNILNGVEEVKYTIRHTNKADANPYTYTCVQPDAT